MLQTRQRLLFDARGSVASITGLSLFVLMGFVGFMYDVGHWYAERQKLQIASDMAALGAAEAASAGVAEGLARAIAHHDAALNGFDSADPETNVDVVVQGGSVEVIMRHQLDGLFSSLILPGGVSVGASSVATWGGQTACVLALDSAAATGIRLDNMGRVVSADCGLHTNASSAMAVRLDSGQISTTELAMAGMFSQSNSGANQVDATVVEQAAEVADPFVSIPEPVVGGCSKSGNHTSYTPVLSLSPGVYCDGLRVQNVPKVRFAPGEYIIKNGNMEINNAVLEGSGVTFFLADGALLIQNYSGTSELSAPTSGDLAGILFFQARNVPASTPTSYFRGGSVMNLDGAIYLPASDLEFNNNAQVTISEAPGAAVIAQNLEFRGSARLEVASLAGGGDVVSSGGQGRQLVR